MRVSRHYEPGTLNLDQLASVVQNLLLVGDVDGDGRTESTASSDRSLGKVLGSCDPAFLQLAFQVKRSDPCVTDVLLYDNFLRIGRRTTP